MALNNDKVPFGFDVGERLKRDKHTHTDTHTDAYTDTAAKENKTKKTYGLVRQTVFDKVTEYAKAHNTSYNAIVCELLDDFIDRNGL